MPQTEPSPSSDGQVSLDGRVIGHRASDKHYCRAVILLFESSEFYAPTGRSRYENICSPCFCTSDRSLSAGPLGRLAPVSHFWTVDWLVFR
jgi:hypothetical protein